jgi:probable rRNA maturation factor
MTLEIDVTVTCPDWPGAIAGSLDDWTRSVVEAALTAARATIDGPAEISLLFCDDAQIKGLNKDWRDQDKPTNVLAFPAAVEPRSPIRLLGDVALSFGTASDEARSEGKSLDRHAAHLVVHGVLHLLGYDHETDAQAEEMETCERIALACLGLPDPYPANGGEA